MGVTTVLFRSAFLFWIWWAWTSKNKARWEADSRLPLNDGGES
jgi:cbb3-type cytochrome oxidase subunit 3